MHDIKCKSGVINIEGETLCYFDKDKYLWNEIVHEDLGVVKCMPTENGKEIIETCPICGADIKQIMI